MTDQVKDFLYVTELYPTTAFITNLKSSDGSSTTDISVTGDLKLNTSSTVQTKNLTGTDSSGINVTAQASDKLGFHGATPIVQETGVAVSAAGIHAALVNLGLITA